MSRIIVQNLPRWMSEDDVRAHFSKQPSLKDAITDVFVARKKNSQNSKNRGFAFVGYKLSDDANTAAKYWDKSFIQSVRLRVALADKLSTPQERKQDSENRGDHPNDSADGSRDPDHADSSHNLHSSSTAIDPTLLEKERKKAEYLELTTGGRSKSWANENIALSQASPVHVVDNASENPQASSGESSFLERLAASGDSDWLKSKVQNASSNQGPAGLNIEGHRSGTGNEEAAANDTCPSRDIAPSSTAGAEFDDAKAKILKTSRLFLRNLPFSATKDDLQNFFSKYTLEEIHVAVDENSGLPKGFAFIHFKKPEDAVDAYCTLDGVSFQGRLLHILPGMEKRQTEISQEELDSLPLKARRKLEKKINARKERHVWNSLFMSGDAVMSSLSDRLGIEKRNLLDPTSAEAGVWQTVAESHVLKEVSDYLESMGVDLSALTNRSGKKSETVIIVKNFPYGTSREEIGAMFSQHGKVVRLLLPPSGTIAFVEFELPSEARQAFKSIAYKRVRDSVIYLEKAPENIFKESTLSDFNTSNRHGGIGTDDAPSFARSSIEDEFVSQEAAADDDEGSSTVYIKNLNFSTTSDALATVFKGQDGFISAFVKTKPNAKNPQQRLSMGFGFAELKNAASARAVVSALNGVILDGHRLELKMARATPSSELENVAKRKRQQPQSRVIIKNLPFETSNSELRNLLSTYGKLKSLRLPRKYDGTIRGFAFAEFATDRDAENVINSLKHAHFLGRHLVFEWAENIDLDDMINAQKKIRRQLESEQFAPHKGTRMIDVDSDDETVDVEG